MTEKVPSARLLAESLIGTELQTLSGRLNTILRIDGEDIVVATSKSPRGKLVPLRTVQAALDSLQSTGSAVIHSRELGYCCSLTGRESVA